MMASETWAHVTNATCPICRGSGDEYIFWSKDEWNTHQKDKADVLAWMKGQSSRNTQDLGNVIVEGPFSCTGCKGKGTIRQVCFHNNIRILIHG